MSIGGATAGIDLSSSDGRRPVRRHRRADPASSTTSTASTSTSRPASTGSGNINQLSTSQANLIRIIDGVLAQMPSNFGLTMAPETAYVTGGSVTYGSIWGAYLPIVKKYADNGRLWWLNMQYYNGSMYGCSGDSYSAGTVQGFTGADQLPEQRAWSSRAPRSGCRTTSRSPACPRSPAPAAATCRRAWWRSAGTPSAVSSRA